MFLFSVYSFEGRTKSYYNLKFRSYICYVLMRKMFIWFRCTTERERRAIHPETAPMLHDVRLCYWPAERLEMERSEASCVKRDRRVRHSQQRSHHRTDLPGDCSYGEFTFICHINLMQHWRGRPSGWILNPSWVLNPPLDLSHDVWGENLPAQGKGSKWIPGCAQIQRKD